MLSALHHGDPRHPPVLFLHGFMGAAADWQPTMEALADRWHSVAVDLPGHGASVAMAGAAYTMEGAARAVLATLDAGGVGPCGVVGYSMGGRLALYLAAHHPARCRALVLESASPGLPTAAERAARRAADEARAVRLETADFGDFLEAWYRQPLFASMARHEGLVAQMRAVRRRNDPHELAHVLRGMGTGRQPSLWERLGTWRVSTCAVAGALDARYVAVARRMAAASRCIRTVEVPGAGHTVHAERPRRFATLLRVFLNQALP